MIDFFFSVAGSKPRALTMPGKHAITQLHPQRGDSQPLFLLSPLLNPFVSFHLFCFPIYYPIIILLMDLFSSVALDMYSLLDHSYIKAHRCERPGTARSFSGPLWLHLPQLTTFYYRWGHQVLDTHRGPQGHTRRENKAWLLPHHTAVSLKAHLILGISSVFLPGTIP